MKKEQLIELGIAEDIAEKIIALYNGEIKELVPKSKLGEVTAQLEAVNTALGDRDKQLTELKKSAGDNEELKNRITALQEDNKKQKEAYEEQIRNIRIDSAIETALTKAGARNIKAARALLNMESLSLDEKGEVVGLDEQVKGLTDSEETGFLFNATDVQGYVPGAGNDGPAVDTSKMNYEQLCAYMENNPGAEI